MKSDRDTRAIVASRFVEVQRSGVSERRLAYVAGADQLLDPDQPQRWGLLRAVADELNTHAGRSEDVSQKIRATHTARTRTAATTSRPRRCRPPSLQVRPSRLAPYFLAQINSELSELCRCVPGSRVDPRSGTSGRLVHLCCSLPASSHPSA